MLHHPPGFLKGWDPAQMELHIIALTAPKVIRNSTAVASEWTEGTSSKIMELARRGGPGKSEMARAMGFCPGGVRQNPSSEQGRMETKSVGATLR
jgi:hypothetical protein